MGWRDRDWAKWTDDERDRFLGGSGGSPRRRRHPRRRSRGRSGSIWTRDISREILVVLAIVAVLTAIARTQGGLDGALDRLAGALSTETAGDIGALPAPIAPSGPEPGGVWPGGAIPYFNTAPEHDWAVRQAVAAWNESGARVRFVAAPKRSAAVVIESVSSQPCGHGRATRGYSMRSTVLVFEPSPREGCDRFSAARVLVHELGHVLGLEHIEQECATMNPVGNYRGTGLCETSEPWRWRCRLLERADVLAAARLYGGTPAQVRRRANCSLYRRVNAPDAPRLLHERSTSHQLAMSVKRPADPALPQFLRGHGEASFSMAYSRGRCATRPNGGRYRWSVAPGQEQVVFQPILGSGVHCLRVWAVDQLGRFSKAASTLRVDVNL